LGHQYPASVVSAEYRSTKRPNKIRWTKPKQCHKSELQYLQDLAEIMVKHDRSHNKDCSALSIDLVRPVPKISEEHTSAYGKTLRNNLEAMMSSKAAPQDDVLAVQLLQEYKGKMIFVNDDPAWPARTNISYH
jgi:hypothetical protein